MPRPSSADTGLIPPNTPTPSRALKSSIPTTVSGCESESRRSPYSASETSNQSSILCCSSSVRTSHFDSRFSVGSCSLNSTSAPSTMDEMNPFGVRQSAGSDR